MKAILAAALAVLGVAACHPTSHPPVPPTPPKPQAQPSKSANDQGLELHRAANASPTGVLVVAADIVHQCPGLKAIKASPPTPDDDAAWLAILQRLAECMGQGDLRQDRVVVSGGMQAGTMVRFVLAKMGIERDRVELIGDDSGTCDLDDDCSYFAVRVDLMPRGAAKVHDL